MLCKQLKRNCIFIFFSFSRVRENVFSSYLIGKLFEAFTGLYQLGLDKVQNFMLWQISYCCRIRNCPILCRKLCGVKKRSQINWQNSLFTQLNRSKTLIFPLGMLLKILFPWWHVHIFVFEVLKISLQERMSLKIRSAEVCPSISGGNAQGDGSCCLELFPAGEEPELVQRLT